MDAQEIDAFLSALPFAERTLSKQGKIRYWLAEKAVGGHMFALLETVPQKTGAEERPLLLSFCAGEEYTALLEEPHFVPAPYLARAKWVAVPIASPLPLSRAKLLLRASYNLTRLKLPASLQRDIEPL